ncbi:MAG: response regulator [Bacteroidota bacterium]
MNSTHFEIGRIMATARRKKLNSVLLIDDNEIDCFINRKILESVDVTDILVFESTITALEYLTQTKKIPELILLDINIPSMDGFKFIDEFRKLKIAQHSTDILILSAFISPDIERIKEKCSGFIEKPLTKKKLFAELDHV